MVEEGAGEEGLVAEGVGEAGLAAEVVGEWPSVVAGLQAAACVRAAEPLLDRRRAPL
jgi:hypothetical protein